MGVKAMNLYTAYKENMLPKDEGYVVSGFFMTDTPYSIIEIISYSEVKNFYSSGDSITFQSNGKKIYILVEPTTYTQKAQEPYVRPSKFQIPLRFNDLNIHTCKNQYKIMYNKIPQMVMTSFTVLKPSGLNYSFIVFAKEGVQQALSGILQKTFNQNANVPLTDAKKVGEILADKVLKELSWPNKEGAGKMKARSSSDVTEKKTTKKVAAKPAANTAVKTPAKAAPKTAAKAPAKTSAKTTKTAVKAAPKTAVKEKAAAKTTAKAAPKTAAKTPAKASAKTTKTAVKAAPKTAAKAPAKTTVKASKTPAKVAPKAAVKEKAPAKTSVKTAKTTTKAAPKTAVKAKAPAKTTVKAAPKTTVKTAKPTTKAAPKTAVKAKAPAKTAAKTVTKTAAKTTAKTKTTKK